LLLDKGFQLKWVVRVVLVTSLIVTVMGYYLYNTVAGATDQMLAQKLGDPNLTDEAMNAFVQQAEQDKFSTVLMLALGLFMLVLLLSVVTIALTHKIAGPIYKLRKIFGTIDGDQLQVYARLRKGDELQDTFRDFSEMLRRLRESRRHDMEELEELSSLSRESGLDEVGKRLDQMVERYDDSVSMD